MSAPNQAELDRFFAATSEDIDTTDAVLDAVTEMQTQLATIDDLLDGLTIGDEEGQLTEIDRQDIAHEMGVIARALRNLARIGDAHVAELRELQMVVFTRAENAELAEARREAKP